MMLDDSRFKQVYRTTTDAIQYAAELQVPPTPEVLEVLIHYLDKDHEKVVEAVDKLLGASHDRLEDRLTQIHDTYFGVTAVNEGLTRVNQGLSSEIAEVSIQVSDSLKGNLEMAAQMREHLRELAEQVSKDDLRTMCKSLAASNKLHLSSTQNMALQLERTQYQLAEMQQELTVLRKNASTDHLTGLPNRRYLDEKMNALSLNKTPHCFAILDLDHFKQVNDNWGHSAGDNILRRLGELLRQNTKGKDVACRVGGEEFALILPDTGLIGAEKLCQLICDMFHSINWVSQSTDEDIGVLSLSGGVTEYRETDSIETLFDRADALLYKAKMDGRNCIATG